MNEKELTFEFLKAMLSNPHITEQAVKQSASPLKKEERAALMVDMIVTSASVYATEFMKRFGEKPLAKKDSCI